MTKESYGEAYTHGYVRTVRYLCSRGISAESSRELAQAAWARGWERIRQLRNEQLVFTWVNTIAINFYRSALRAAPELEPLRDYSNLKENSLASIDVERILSLCCPQQRKLFQRCLEGETVEEIAKEEQTSITAIRLRIMRARKQAFRMISTSKRSADVAL